jgi:thioester reductase-like protein
MPDLPSPLIIPKLSDNNLFQIIDYWVAAQPDALLYSFLDSRGDVLEQLTYQQFSDSVDRLAGYFHHSIKANHGSRILLSYQPGLELVCALFACNKAGFVGVPTLPLHVHQLQGWLYSINHILDDSQAAGIAMCSTTWKILDACQPGVAEGTAIRDRIIALNPLITTEAVNLEFSRPAFQPSETFFLQYTSGSTTEPKGVMVSHSNLIANAEAVVDHRLPITVSWLPQQHDMGLIGYYINIVLSGGSTYGFSPSSFIRRPALWIETITRYGATATSIPNFALELCLNDRRIPKSSLKQFDLSSLRFLMVAAEPVNPANFTAFLKKFSVCGLKPESMFVAYGLAEFTLAVSNYGRRSISLDRNALALGVVKSAENSASHPVVRLMSCGRVVGDTHMEIVDPDNHLPVGAGKTGEVWLSGKSKAQGYWNNPVKTKTVFEARMDSNQYRSARYLRTGDIGFVDKGELFICGRLKDMLIINGRNIYPQDIENEVQRATPKIRSNSVVAIADEGSYAIIVLAELVSVKDIPDSLFIIGAVRDRIQIPITNLIFLPPRSIARTSSGKIRRARTRQMFEQGLLNVIANNRKNNVYITESEADADLDQLEALKQRYRLSGEEEFTLFDAGIDSLDLIILLHWLRDKCRSLNARNLSTRINVRLFGILKVKHIFAAGRMLNESPELAVGWLTDVINQALNARIEHEQRIMLVDRVYRRPEGTTGKTQSVITAEPQATDILLTGGTGFLGPFLLLSILQQTNNNIHVLVRGDDHVQAERRLRREFISTVGHDAPMHCFDERVNILCGELSRPHFGLSHAEWDYLLSNIGSIYHNGAMVNYLLDYEHMRPTNVAGTAHVIDLAFSGKRKILNYISTTFIFGWAAKDVLYETDQNSGMDHLDFGYSQTKWVAEQLVLSAMDQGLDARIFRPALITPALDGRGGNLDITLRLLAFMIKHGVCVDTQNQVSLMPVDLTANNIVAIAGQSGTINKTFHITRDRLETMPQITEFISQITNIRFDAFSLKDFIPEVVERCTRDDLLYPLLDFLVESVDNIAAMEYKLYDNSCYRSARDQSPHGLQDPPLESVVAGIISYLKRKDLLTHEPSG